MFDLERENGNNLINTYVALKILHLYKRKLNN